MFDFYPKSLSLLFAGSSLALLQGTFTAKAQDLILTLSRHNPLGNNKSCHYLFTMCYEINIRAFPPWRIACSALVPIFSGSSNNPDILGTPANAKRMY